MSGQCFDHLEGLSCLQYSLKCLIAPPELAHGSNLDWAWSLEAR